MQIKALDACWRQRKAPRSAIWPGRVSHPVRPVIAPLRAWWNNGPFSARSASIRLAPTAFTLNACASLRARGPVSPHSICGPSRRCAAARLLVATVLDTITRLTDDTVTLFERAIGRMFRRAEIREQDALIRDARAINDKVRLLARLGAALIEAKASGIDLQEAVASAIGWDKLARSVEEAKRLTRPDKTDLPALAARAWPVLHRLGPLFLGSLRFHALPAAAATLRAVEFCARFTKAAAANGREAYRQAFSGRHGAKPC